MAISLPIENVLIQVRAKLQSEHIKLWLPPYYEEGIGPVDSELEVSASGRNTFKRYFRRLISFCCLCRN